MKTTNTTNIIIGIVALAIAGTSIYFGTKANSVEVLDTVISVEEAQQMIDAEKSVEQETATTSTSTAEVIVEEEVAIEVKPVETVKPTTPTTPTKPVVVPTPPVVTGPKSFTREQVMAHATEASCYTAIEGKVYDVSAFIREHPGGSKEILRICGKDGTNSFNSEHSRDMDAKALLADFQIGILAD